MKRHLKRLLFLSVVFFLSACSFWEMEEATRTFYIEEEGIQSTLVYTYRGDEVLKQSTENIVQYETFGIETKEDAEEFFSLFVNHELENIHGITYSIDYQENQLTEKITIDYEEVDIGEIKDLPEMNFQGNVENGISMKASAKLLLEEGFKEIE